MGTRHTRARSLRAVTAVIALYAFVLQAFLGGLMPLGAPAPGGVLCLTMDTHGPVDDGPAGPVPHHSGDCCLAAHLAAGAEPPRPPATLLAWSRRAAIRIAWEPVAAASARGPPGSIAHPRGPPVV
ncbi:hypothetical protein [Methylobacterium planeticum]|uniref:DUF2946 domain-containing protein n=1 Tax=Methylobacterium planeticum TaxID=2615211 RepID=A0A6N6MZI5_9HYPH|nr:hypothetical protein [Methylobacterium planeticum]KAB1075085.1 hypothetical protein F6X51_04130 [Methylobacterium planeticum]